jgi:hypothetical protein
LSSLFSAVKTPLLSIPEFFSSIITSIFSMHQFAFVRIPAVKTHNRNYGGTRTL